MEQLCRTCLKYNSINVNIFQHSQNNKYISDLIRELTSIKIKQIDGFPIHMCCNCLQKLNFILKFKEMVAQSDRRLHLMFRNKVVKDIKFVNPNAAIVCLKKESNFAQEILNKTLDIPNANNTCPGETTNDEESESMADRNLLVVYDIQDDCAVEKQEETESVLIGKRQGDEHHDDSIQGQSIKDNTKTNQISIAKSEIIEKLSNRRELLKDNGDNKKIENSRPKPNTTKICSLSKMKKQQRLKYNNEAQLKLLNNPDYIRVKEMKLTKQERDRATVHCQECDRSFNFRYYVSVHAHFHTGNLPYKCDRCDARFPKLSRLTQHKQVHTKGFSCDVCGRKFSLKATLQMHKLTHSDEMHHKCNICNKQFRCPPALRTHMSVHKEERKFVCEICGKGFVDSARLQHHKRTHITDKKFVCTICGKPFKSKLTLGQHLKRHSDDKPYTCDYCGKGFKCKNTLQIHVWIHTGEKKFACKICGKRFTQKGCLPRHMRVHTGETPYPCKFCSASFKYSHHLLKHMKKTHENEEDDVIQE